MVYNKELEYVRYFQHSDKGEGICLLLAMVTSMSLITFPLAYRSLVTVVHFSDSSQEVVTD